MESRCRYDEPEVRAESSMDWCFLAVKDFWGENKECMCERGSVLTGQRRSAMEMHRCFSGSMWVRPRRQVDGGGTLLRSS